MDNLSFHKVAGVKVATENTEVQVVYLPPYSADLNSIENVFAKLKTLLRKAKLHTMNGLWKRWGELCDVFSPQECKSYFKHAGYAKM